MPLSDPRTQLQDSLAGDLEHRRRVALETLTPCEGRLAKPGPQ